MASGWSKEEISRRLDREREQNRRAIHDREEDVRVKQLELELVEYDRIEQKVNHRLKVYDQKRKNKCEYISNYHIFFINTIEKNILTQAVFFKYSRIFS